MFDTRKKTDDLRAHTHEHMERARLVFEDLQRQFDAGGFHLSKGRPWPRHGTWVWGSVMHCSLPDVKSVVSLLLAGALPAPAQYGVEAVPRFDSSGSHAYFVYSRPWRTRTGTDHVLCLAERRAG